MAGTASNLGQHRRTRGQSHGFDRKHKLGMSGLPQEPHRHAQDAVGQAWRSFVLIATAAILAYSNSFSGPFVFDDASSIVTNPTVRHLWPPWAPFFPPHASLTVQGRPLLNFSLALNYALSGTAVWSYHAVNLIIHILAAGALYGLARRTLLLVGGRTAECAPGLALATALLWTVHPLQTESVTYIVQRTESLMGLFYLLTLYTFVRGATGESPVRWRIASALCCAAGMATKEVMVSAPAIVLLYDRTFIAGTLRGAWRERRIYYIALAGTWMVLALLIYGAGGNRGGSKGFDVGVNWWSWWATQFPAILTYLRLTFWPRPLVFEYGVEWTNGGAGFAWSVAAVGGLLAATTWAVVRRTGAGFLGVCFFAILAPTSLTPGTSQMTAEHRMYLPLAAVVVAVLIAVNRLVANKFRWIETAAVLAIGLVLIGLTWMRNRDYRSEVAIWQDTVDKRPDNALAHQMLGMAEDKVGETAHALENYHQALRIMPNFAIAHESLGELLFKMREPDAAMEQFQTALLLRADFPDAEDNLGAILLQKGRYREAVPLLRKALAAKPDYVEAHYNLATALSALGDSRGAIAEFEAALALRPDYIAAHYNLANTLAENARVPEAVSHYKTALQLDPQNSRAEYNLGNTLAASGQPSLAVSHYRRAVEIDPHYIEAYNNLGSALLDLGQLEAAATQFEEALRLDPQFADARENLRRLRAVQKPAR